MSNELTQEQQAAIKETVRVMLSEATLHVKSAIDAIQSDPHQWSTRPCETCRFVSNVLKSPFGCYRYAEERAAREAAFQRVQGAKQ